MTSPHTIIEHTSPIQMNHESGTFVPLIGAVFVFLCLVLFIGMLSDRVLGVVRASRSKAVLLSTVVFAALGALGIFYIMTSI